MQYVTFEEMLSVPIRNGLTKPKAVRGRGVKMISMGEIFAHSRIGNIEMDLVPVTDSERDNYAIQKDDLLFARQSLTLDGAGKCSIVTSVTEDTVFESHLIRARIDPHKANPYFLYYYFNSYAGKENIKTIVEQVAAAGIRGSDLIRLNIPLPSLDVQNRIVGLLDCIDRKIETNKKINDNLLHQAEALFKEQFLSHDEVPHGWKWMALSDVCEMSAGGDKPKIISDNKTEKCPYPVYSNGISNEGLYGFTTDYKINAESVTVSARGTIGVVYLRHIRQYSRFSVK